MLPDERYIVSWAEMKQLLTDAVALVLSLSLFAYCINYSFPVKIAAFAALFVAAIVISRNKGVWSGVSIRSMFSASMLLYIIIAFEMGIAGAMYYRGSFGMPVLPAVWNGFAWVAVIIGTMEEWVFRGFLQGLLNRLHPRFALLFAALAHATYKACLFLPPVAQYHYSIALFYTWSLGAFILIGMLRYYSKSIVPAIIAHAIFDLLVYAENQHAPWWVW